MVEWNSLGVFISVCGSVCVSLCFAIQKSHCKKIKICFGLIDCDRVVPEDTPDEEAPTNP